MKKLTGIVIVLLAALAMLCIVPCVNAAIVNYGFESGDNNFAFGGLYPPLPDQYVNGGSLVQLGYGWNTTEPNVNIQVPYFAGLLLPEAKQEGNYGLWMKCNETIAWSADLRQVNLPEDIIKIEGWYKVADVVHNQNYNEIYATVGYPGYYEVILDISNVDSTTDWMYFSWDNTNNLPITELELALWTDPGEELVVYWDNIAVTYGE